MFCEFESEIDAYKHGEHDAEHDVQIIDEPKNPPRFFEYYLLGYEDSKWKSMHE